MLKKIAELALIILFFGIIGLGVLSAIGMAILAPIIWLSSLI